MSERLTATVVGRVQGVGFRNFVETRAIKLELVGWVRNDPQDRRRVQVVAEGERGALEALLKSLQSGPLIAQVQSVQTEWSAASGKFSNFQVNYD